VSLSKKTFLISLILLICFVGISIRIDSKQLAAFDTWVAAYIQGFMTDEMTVIMIFITNVGSYKVEYPLLFVVCLYWLYRKNRLFPILLSINLIGVRLLNTLFKSFYERPRPTTEHLVAAAGYSFPSGHAMISSGFYGFFAFLIFYELRKKTNKAFLAPVFIGMLILFIGISRIYLGVHYPSDVLAGFLAGGLWLNCFIAFFNYKQNIEKNRVPEKGK